MEKMKTNSILINKIIQNSEFPINSDKQKKYHLQIPYFQGIDKFEKQLYKYIEFPKCNRNTTSILDVYNIIAEFLIVNPLNYLHSITSKQLIKRSSKDINVIKAEKFAKSLGVDAYYDDNIKIAEIVNKVLNNLNSKNYKLPPQIMVKNYFQCLLSRKYNLADFDMKSPQRVLLNVKNFNKFNVNDERIMKTIYHEIGHYLHFIKCNDIYFLLEQSNFKPDIADIISKNIRPYAANSPLEFVADVFAEKMMGKNHNNELINLYEFLGGP